MIVVIGIIIVLSAILGGFVFEGGKILALLHPAMSESVIIAGAAVGAMVVMTPKKILIDVFRGLIQTLKGAPYSRAAYDDLFKALYELFLLARREGMIALEGHLSNPAESSIFKKYPAFLSHHEPVEFLCGALRPIVDGRVKPEQLKKLLDTQLNASNNEAHAPVNVITKMADSLPGFGIVAAVMGIVITMGAINGPVEVIGEKVGSALVGTFLGILLCYGIVGPLASNLEFIVIAEEAYLHCIATAVNEFVNGIAPIMAIEVARRGLSSEMRPTEDEMEAMLKPLNVQPQT